MLQVVLRLWCSISSRIYKFDIRHWNFQYTRISVSLLLFSIFFISSVQAENFDGDSITDPLQYFKDILYFEPNAGVWDSDIRYQLSGPGKLIRFKDSSIIFTIYESANQANRTNSGNRSLDYKSYIESSLALIKSRYESQTSPLNANDE